MGSRIQHAGLWCAVFVWVFFAGLAGAGNIDPDGNGRKYAYGAAVGWCNFDPAEGPGVTVEDDRLTGFVWVESIGWIKLDPQFGGVVQDGRGSLSGYAWGDNAGWINFSCETNGTCDLVDYGVRIDLATGVFSGYAWGENIGWIKFDYTGFPDPSTGYIETHWRMNGDVSSNGAVNLEDAIIALQVCAANPSAPAPHSGADVDDDGRCGIAEAGYILQHLSGLRQK